MRRIVSALCALGILLGAAPIMAFAAGGALQTDPVILVADCAVGTQQTVLDFEIPQKGEYEIQLSYKPLQEKTPAMKLRVSVDGVSVVPEDAEILLPRFWTNDAIYQVDGNGNQFAPDQLLYEDTLTYKLLDTSNFGVNNIVVSLEAGRHTISIANLENDSFYLERVILTGTQAVADYAGVSQPELCYTGEPFHIEGESAYLKSSYWLNNASDNSSSKVYPCDPVKTKVNYIGGATWSDAGDSITWKVDAPQDGYYAISFTYKQNFVLNGNVYRWLTVNGQTPFTEAYTIAFPYNTDWEGISPKSEAGQRYAVYLHQGENELTLTATLGRYQEVSQMLNTTLEKVGDMFLDIAMVTGETVDIYRDYRLFEQVKDFDARLQEMYDELTAIDAKMLEITNGDVGSYSTAIRNMQNALKLMLENPYTAHRYKTNYDSCYTALTSCATDMRNAPLSIDRITFSQVDDSLEGKGWLASWWDSLVFGVRRFFASFTEDYNNVSGSTDSTESITIWVNWGRDQAQILNELIQSSFTPDSNIAVEVKITNATVVQGIASGNGPDVLLQRSRTEPVNLAMRGVLYDLSTFEDCQEVLERFNEGAEVPYTYNGGLYALPDTQTFFMMFYRTDVFEELGLDVPTTWDEFEQVTRTLAKQNLDAWLPYTQLTDLVVANTGVGSLNLFPTMMIQNGLSLYNEEMTRTTLTETDTIQVFDDWTGNYTKLKVPYQLDFYNRFKAGTCPIGVAPYVTYSTLKDAAKEIDGKWRMTNIPGIVQPDGTINNTSAGGGTGCVIMKDCKNPDAAWEFLKWWTSAETQLAYSNKLESALGTVGRIAVANKEAFAEMAWDRTMSQDILDAFGNVTEIYEIPGSYYISRSIDFAFWNVINKNEVPKDMLITWGEEADEEIRRKLEQYENK